MSSTLLLLSALVASCETRPQAGCPTFRGVWTHGAKTGPQTYVATSPSESGAFNVFDILNASSWRVSNVTILANGTLSAHYDNGKHDNGNPNADCTGISWSDGTSWELSRALSGPLRLHFNCHTHDDVGWNEAYLQYYYGNGPLTGRNVSQILRAVVAGLREDTRRRFSYVEQAYFSVYYDSQLPADQAIIRELVESRQLVFLNGGWSMHDEAASEGRALFTPARSVSSRPAPL